MSTKSCAKARAVGPLTLEAWSAIERCCQTIPVSIPHDVMFRGGETIQSGPLSGCTGTAYQWEGRTVTAASGAFGLIAFRLDGPYDNREAWEAFKSVAGQLSEADLLDLALIALDQGGLTLNEQRQIAAIIAKVNR